MFTIPPSAPLLYSTRMADGLSPAPAECVRRNAVAQTSNPNSYVYESGHVRLPLANGDGTSRAFDHNKAEICVVDPINGGGRVFDPNSVSDNDIRDAWKATGNAAKAMDYLLDLVERRGSKPPIDVYNEKAAAQNLAQHDAPPPVAASPKQLDMLMSNQPSFVPPPVQPQAAPAPAAEAHSPPQQPYQIERVTPVAPEVLDMLGKMATAISGISQRLSAQEERQQKTAEAQQQVGAELTRQLERPSPAPLRDPLRNVPRQAPAQHMPAQGQTTITPPLQPELMAPGKPQFEVIFRMGDGGIYRAKYHHVSLNDCNLVLYYDTRYEGGGEFRPPARTQFEIELPWLQQRLLATYMDQCDQFGLFDWFALLVQPLEGEV